MEVCVFVGLPSAATRRVRGNTALAQTVGRYNDFRLILHIDRRKIQNLPDCLGLAVTYSPTPEDAVPSAQRHLTAGFGMEPGVLLVL